MPITIQTPIPGGPVGPGLLISGRTDFIGPFPSDSHWHFEVLGGTTSEDPIIGWDIPLSAQDQHLFQMVIGSTTNEIQTNQPFTQIGGDVRLVVQLAQGLFDPPIEQTSVNVKWDPVGMAWTLPQQVQGGFTAADRSLLQQTESRTQLLGNVGDLVLQTASGPINMTLAQLFSRSTLDRLTLDELTSGETCDPVRVNISFNWFHAIIVRVTTIAPDLVPKTPDQNWYFPDLAVLRVFRGADLEFRRGIHTPTFIQEKPWQWGWSFLNQVPILGTPPETTVAVDWRAGCCGQVFGMFLN